MSEAIGNPQRSREKKTADVVVAALAFSFCAAVVLIRILLGWGIDVYAVVSWPGALLEGYGFLAIALWSLGRIFFRGPMPVLRFGPAAAVALTVLLIWPFALERRVTAWNFRSRLAARTEVVELARKGKVKRIEDGPCGCYYGRLPSEYAHLSSGGIISIAPRGNDVSVTFFVSRSWYFGDDNYTALIFRSDEGVPSDEVEDTYTFVQVARWAPHWFFVVHS